GHRRGGSESSSSPAKLLGQGVHRTAERAAAGTAYPPRRQYVPAGLSAYLTRPFRPASACELQCPVRASPSCQTRTGCPLTYNTRPNPRSITRNSLLAWAGSRFLPVYRVLSGCVGPRKCTVAPAI